MEKSINEYLDKVFSPYSSEGISTITELSTTSVNDRILKLLASLKVEMKCFSEELVFRELKPEHISFLMSEKFVQLAAELIQQKSLNDRIIEIYCGENGFDR